MRNFALSLTSFVLLFISSCSLFSNNISKPKVLSPDIFIITSPINQEQAKLSDNFLGLAKKELLFRNSHYEIFEICNDLGYKASPDYHDTSNPKDIITDTIFSSVNQANKVCKPNANKILSALIQKFDDYSKQRPSQEIVVFAQIPWKEKDLTESESKSLAVKFSKIHPKIKRMYFFAESESGGKIIKIFTDAGTNKIRTAGLSKEEIKNMVAEASILLKQH